MSESNNTTAAVSFIGTGSYLPERILTNADLEKMVETSDEWIRTRTGISERHLAREDESTSDMAAVAAKNAVESAGISPEEIDMIIVATVTADMPFPSTACLVQEKIGAKRAFCFDLEAACSGFLYAVEQARNALACGTIRTALVIGAEKLSAVTDWQDRGTCVLFGDGAGAVILRRTEKPGILSFFGGSDGSLSHLLSIPGGGSRHPASPETLDQRLHYMKMTGNEVFKHAVRCMCDSAQKALERAGKTVDDVDLLIPHQANMRIIQAIGKRLGLGSDKVFMNLDKVGNVSAASIPLALDEAVRKGLVRNGQKMLFVAFGGGFTWGASLMEWNDGK
jgi:3-oxoacyl-[acyl-carrier-protein] synthase-3